MKEQRLEEKQQEQEKLKAEVKREEEEQEKLKAEVKRKEGSRRS